MKNFLVAGFLCLFVHANSLAQSIQVFPTHWWIGMKHSNVQLLVKGSDPKFNSTQVSINYPGVTLTKVHKLENGKYFAIDVAIAEDAKPGNVPIDFKVGRKTQTLQWPLKERKKDVPFAQGVTQEDLIYLIMPDRFSNGDPTNDKVKKLKDQSLNRDSLYDRHGGDIQGVINHLDYLQELGVTALWLTPVFENDMPHRTEHGYAITNHYKIESRLGTSDLYKQLSAELHRRGMKLVQDAVYNHVGLYHMLVQDKPTSDWLHEWPQYTNTDLQRPTADGPLCCLGRQETHERRLVYPNDARPESK